MIKVIHSFFGPLAAAPQYVALSQNTLSAGDCETSCCRSRTQNAAKCLFVNFEWIKRVQEKSKKSQCLVGPMEDRSVIRTGRLAVSTKLLAFPGQLLTTEVRVIC